MPDGVQRFRATIVLADFVNVDGLGKANIIGAGGRVIPLLPHPPSTPPTMQAMPQLTPPFSLFVGLTADLPTDDSPAVEIVLTTATGAVVSLPGVGGAKAQNLRIAQNVAFTPPASPGVTLPAGAVPSSAQFALNFANGLPLKAGFSYQWRVQVDHEVIETYSFYVPAASAGIVIG